MRWRGESHFPFHKEEKKEKKEKRKGKERKGKMKEKGHLSRCPQ